MKIVAGLVVAALLAAATVVLAASPQAPRTMKLACAKKGSGELQYVGKAGDCPSSRGKLIHFPADAPVHVCQETNGGALSRVGGPAACRPPKHPGTRAVVLPQTTDQKLCTAKSDGAARAVGSFSACKGSERRAVLKGLAAPQARDDSATTGEETPRAIAVLANDSGFRELRVASLDTRGTKGRVTRNSNGTVRYAPNGRFNSLRAGQTGRDSFRYRATDRVHDSNAATVRVTVTGVNDAPAAANDAASTDKDSPTTITVLANDSDPDGEALQVAGLDTTGTKGTVVVNPNSTVSYDPNGAFDALAPGETAHDTFKYRANDGHVSSGQATVDVTVGGLNHAPTVATSAGATSYLEGAAATVVDPGVTVTDDDDANIESATVAITGGFEAGDKLQFVPQNGIGGGFDAGTGVLTLSGTASKADYQSMLRSVKFASESDDPATSKTVSFEVSDGGLDSAPDTKALAITRVNDAPSVSTTGGSLAYTEGSGAVAVDSAVTVSDPDSATISGATVRISSSFQASEDELGFANANGITGSYDDTTGTLTLTGDAPKSDYQAALRSVKYTNSSDNPGPSRTVSFRVTDSASSQSATATRTITLGGVNDAPVVTTSSGSTPYTEAAPATAVDGALTVADTDNANLAGASATVVGLQTGDELQFSTQNGISGSYDSGTGVLTLSGAASKANYETALRSVKFRTTNDNPATTRTIEFRASDGTDQSSPASKTIAVSGANDAPTVATTGGQLGYTEGSGTVVIDSGVALSDPDSTNMSSAKVSISTGFVSADDALVFADQNGIVGAYDDTTGVLTLSGAATRAQYEAALRSVQYENVNQDPSGTKTVKFQVTDDGALPSNDATRQIALIGTNDAPTVTASGGSTTYAENAAATAVDPGVTLSDPDDTNLEGATVKISAGLRGGDVLAFTAANGITSNYDSGTGTLTLSGTSSKANYQAALAAVTYRSTSDDPGTARTIDLTVNDGSLGSNTAQKSIAITPSNDAPALTASSGALPYQEADGPKAIDPGIVLADPDSPNMSGATVTISSGFVAAEDELSFTAPGGNPVSGSYNDANGTMTLSGTATRAQYEAALRAVKYENVSDDPTDSRTITFQVTDDAAAASNGATRNIDINGVSDPPVVTTTGGTTPYTEGAAATEVDTGLTVADSDDANIDSAKVRISSGLQTGDELSLATQNGISGSYDSNTGILTVSGVASKSHYQTALRAVKFRTTNDAPTSSRTIEFTVNDGDADSAPASKGISITPVNDKPTITPTGFPLSYTEGDGAVAVDPNLTVADPDSASMSGATVTISANFTAAEDELAFTPPGGSPISGSYNDVNGTMTLSGSGTRAQYEAALQAVTYENSSQDPSEATRTVSFTVTDDGAATSDPASRSVLVSQVNDAPVVTPSNGSTPYTEGDPATTIDGSVTVTDVDDASLDHATVRISSGFQTGDDLLEFTDGNGIAGQYHGDTGVLNLSGVSSVANYETALRSVTFRHTGDNPVASKTIEFQVNDGGADSNTPTKEIALTLVNDAPTVTMTAAALSYTENEGRKDIDTGLDLVDADSAQLTGATVSISAGFSSAQDELAFNDQNGITGDYNDSTGVLTLSGPASVSDYRTALRSVAYENVSDAPTSSRTISVTATDSASATSSAATRGISISASNDAPSAVGDTNTTDEDTVVSEPAPGVLGNDTDADGVPPDTKTVTKLNGSTTLTGTSTKGAPVTINADGSYTYDPTGVAEFEALSGGDSASDSFTYTMRDTAGAESSATVSITVNGLSNPPDAVDDTFHTNGNTVLYAGTTRPVGQAGRSIDASVLDNDTDPDTPTLTVTPITDGPTTLGGTFTIESDGDFTYTPPTGVDGVSDTFTYQVSDGTTTDTAVVTIPLAERAWYVRNDAAANGTGRSSDPFDTLAEAESASNANDTVYVFDGDGTTTGYTTGYALDPGERLIGEASDLTMDPDGGGGLGSETYFTGASANRPTLTASGEDVVTLASGATVRGVGLDPSTGGGGIFGTGGTTDGTIDNVEIVDAGTPGEFAGFELVGTTGTFDVSDLTVSMQTAGAVRLTNAGTVNFASAGKISLASAGSAALFAFGTNMGAGSTFDDLTTTASTSGGVSLLNTTGTVALGDGVGSDLDITTTASASGGLFTANAGTVTVPGAGTSNIHANGGPAVDVNATAATLALDDVDSADSTTDGINLDGLGTGGFTAASGDITGAQGRAFDVNAGSGDVTYPGTIGDGTGATANVSNRTGGTVTLSGAIADGSDAGGGITVSNNTAGATVFSGTSKVLNTGAGDGFVMTNNNGHSVTFSNGGLDIDTTSGKGFEAVAGPPDGDGNVAVGGTVTVAGTANTIDTTTGRALNVNITDIGAGDLNFRSINAGTAVSGPVNGIRLNATGTAGGLTVAGNGTAGSGGTIQKTTGDGVLLKDTVDPSLAWMVVDDSGDNGVSADGVSGLSIANSQLNRNGAQAEAGAVNDAGIHIEDLAGTANAITSTDVLDSHNSNLDWDPNSSSAQSTLTTTGSKFNSAGENVGEGRSGIALTATGTANVKLAVSGGELNGNPAKGLLTSGSSGTQTRVDLSGTQIDDNAESGVSLAVGGTAQGVYALDGATLNRSGQRAIVMEANGSSKLDATVTDNTIGTDGVAGSGTGGLEGVFADVSDSADGAVDVSGNTIHSTAQVGIGLFTGNSAATPGTLDATVRDNTVGAPEALDAHAIDANAQGDNDLCLDIAGNDAAGAGSTFASSEDIAVHQLDTSTFRLERFTGDGTNDTAVETFLLEQNPLTDTAFAEHTTGFTGVDDETCQSPALP
ncbi:MAG TPA: tandem-95 repeat protein [Thermoleophilaceae bacterium]|nr:tandem-95 repeat protein [Thermoleophilaceae bacterium]